MKDEILVKAEHVSKKFCKSLKRSLYYGVVDTAREFFGMSRSEVLRKDEFWAVKDISFTLRRGECLGIIGHNGAGKSTLLKMLNGLIRPDEGRIEMHGRIGALIELGAGFNPVLSGRENIYNNASVLGFSKDEIDKKIERIIDYSEIRDFIDMPVQNYSSGMKVRLGFAVAAQMEPDILIIDEVLAVGDLGFVLKCFNTIDQLLPNTAVLFVSHSMPMVSRITTDILIMEKGKPEYIGHDVSKGIDLYYNKFANKPSSFSNSEEVKLTNINLSSKDGKRHGVEDVLVIKWCENLNLEFDLKIDNRYKYPGISIVIHDKEYRGVGTYMINRKEKDFENRGESMHFRIALENLQLSKGIYSITISFAGNNNKLPLLRAQSVIFFQVESEHDIWTPLLLKGKFDYSN
jgi:homopolymeric O-antigen transport system ATP-binding protein